MTKRQKIIGIVISMLAIIGVVTTVLVLTWQRSQAPGESAAVRDVSSQQASPQQNTTQQPPDQTPQSNAVRTAGYYGDYTDARAADRSYDKTILFFHAPWCSECRAFEQAIQADPIPADVQILKVDYDKRQDLRQKYGVRIQSTFVKLDDDDDQDNDHDVWVGYGKDKSINAILRNL